MKNANKAFTLVELLAVIVILGIIAFLIFPNVSKTIEESREKAYARQISILEEAAQKYTKENIDKLSSDKRCISIDTLISSGYIAAKDKDNGKYVVLNPKTDEPLSGGVQVKYDDTYNQYEYTYNSNCNKKIKVTLDANGGTLGSSSSTKDVEYYDDYGELPTPTKTGYKFLGWNGKNKFNLSKAEYRKSSVSNQQTLLLDGSYKDNNKGRGIQIQKFLDSSIVETTTICNKTKSTLCNNYSFYKTVIVKNDTFNSLRLKLDTTSGDSAIHINDTLIDEKTYTFSFKIETIDFESAKAAISNIQIEEGSTATEYEPYYITPSTVVVQENNHTLTAIWEAE